jgi:hypothetical protein
MCNIKCGLMLIRRETALVTGPEGESLAPLARETPRVLGLGISFAPLVLGEAVQRDIGGPARSRQGRAILPAQFLSLYVRYLRTHVQCTVPCSKYVRASRGCSSIMHAPYGEVFLDAGLFHASTCPA